MRIASIVLAIACSAAPVWAATMPRLTNVNGQYTVVARTGGEWIEAGRVGFDRFCRTREILLDASVRGATEFRLNASGGGATHIDYVTLDGAAPVACERAQLRKLVVCDADVAPCADGGIVVSFAAPARAGSSMMLTARIEAMEISEQALNFPAGNTGAPVTDRSRFRTYRPGSRPGALSVDGDLSEENLGEPFLCERVRVDSGHPQGDTWIWVMDDSEALFVAIDYTPDNTMDGEKDYATVYARTSTGVREFKLSMADLTWGAPGFAYTPRAGYEHKVYEFRIPLAGLARESGGTIDLAFSAYGTSSVGSQSAGQGSVAYDDDNDRFLFAHSWGSVYAGMLLYDSAGVLLDEVDLDADYAYDLRPAVAYDTTAGRYLVVWENFAGAGSGTPNAIGGRLIASDGTPTGSEFAVSGGFADACAFCEIACDPGASSFLAVWQDQRDGYSAIYGALIDDSTTPPTVGSDFKISDSTTASNPSVAFNAAGSQYVVVWEEAGGILGRLVTSAGAPSGTAQTLAAAGLAPAVAYDADAGRFALVFEDGSGSPNVEMIFVSTALVPDAAGSFTVSEVTASYTPGISYSTSGDLFCVTWSSAGPQAVMARLVNPDKSFVFGSFAAFHGDDHPSGSAAHATNGTFCTATPWSGAAILGEPSIKAEDREITVSEAGATDTIDVHLLYPPTADVIVNIASADTGEVTVGSPTLTFSSANWNIAQTFTVAAVDDAVIDPNRTTLVNLSVDAASDAIYVAAAPTAMIPVRAGDNEPRVLTLTITAASAGENAGVLAAQGQVSSGLAVGVDTAIQLASDMTGELTVPGSVTILANASSATFDLTVIQDGVVDGDQTVTVTATRSTWTSDSDTIDILDEAAPAPTPADDDDDCGASDDAPVALALACLLAARGLLRRRGDRGPAQRA